MPPTKAPAAEARADMPTKQLFAICACTAVIVGGGCARPWTASFASSADAAAVDTSASVAAATSPSANPIDRDFAPAPAGEPIDPASAPLELAGVLDQLQQIRAIDPTAEQKLMDQLRRTPADSWPLVAEQFRASLAYREQLLSSPNRLGIPADRAPAEPFAALPATPTSESPRLYQFGAEPQIDNSTSLPIGVSPTGITPAALSSLQDARALPASETSEVMQATLNAPNEPFSSTASTVPDTESLSRSRPAAVEDWQQLVANAADDLSHRVAPSPATTAEVHQHVSLRILRLLAADTEGALEPIPGISPAEQDYWSRQLFALATYMDHHGQPDEKRRAAASVMHLDEAVSHLRELGSLSVRNLSFCKNVYGYGAIEPYDEDAFSPGQQVSLYVEVENYHSQSTAKGFCTLLGSTYEILNDKGVRVGGGEIPDVNDCCRSRRRDFHIQYGITLPDALPPGRYQLQLVIKDHQSDKRGTATAAFEIKDSVAGRLNSRDIH